MTSVVKTRPKEASYFDLIAPILQQCVVTRSKTPTPKDLLNGAKPLSAWIEQRALAERTGNKPAVRQAIETGLSEAAILERLRRVATELAEDRALLAGFGDEGAVEPNQERNTSYHKLFRFIEHLLTKPPTKISRLALRFQVDEATIRRWLEGQDLKYVQDAAQQLVETLLILCAIPEPPEPVLIQGPLKSFDDLKFLGSLRYALLALYERNPPTIAQARFIPGLLAVLNSNFQGGPAARVTIIAHPNAGKNGMILVAGLAAIAWSRGPVMVLQPYRTQIAESFDTWAAAVAGRTIAAEAGARSITVAGSSALLTDSDMSITRGQRDLVAIIPEKLAVLSRHTPLVEFCNFLVCDELAWLLDPERGPKLEIVLTLAKAARSPIVAVGAAIAEPAAEQIARWLGDLRPTEDPREKGLLLMDTSIPRDPPIEYVIWRRDGARICWRKESDEVDASTDPFTSDRWEDSVADLIVRELNEFPERQILVFIESREKVVDVADVIRSRIEVDDGLRKLLAQQADDQAQTPLSDLWLGDPPYGRRNIAQILEERVGIHSRDVPKLNLVNIESAFRRGRLRVLCATTTVEAGVNLPVDTVVQVGLVDHRGRRLRQAALEQRLGRCGRTLPNREKRAGRGIVYVDDQNQRIDRVIPRRILTPDPARDSGLTPEHQALLMLVALGQGSLDEQQLAGVLDHSYWAYDRDDQEVFRAKKRAIEELRHNKLITSFSEQRNGQTLTLWRATPLGLAVAAALLLPSDAHHLERLVRTAEALGESERSAWRAGVIHAACLVPSMAAADRRPRAKDIKLSGREDIRARMSTWCHPDRAAGAFAFGLPRRTKMPAAGELGEAVGRVLERRPRAGEETAVVRTYVGWLWAEGVEIDLPALGELNEHVVEQDLGYYLSHIVRAAAWLATYENKFILAGALEDLAMQVYAGAPPEAQHVTTMYEGWIDRRTAMKWVTEGKELKELLPRVPESARTRAHEEIDRRLERRRKNAESKAASVMGDDGILAERMEDAAQLSELLKAVWDENDAASQPVVESGDIVRAGDVTIQYVEKIADPAPPYKTDVLVSSTFLDDALAVSRAPQPVTVLGPEELMWLLYELSNLERPVDLLRSLAAERRVCRPELISAHANELRHRQATAVVGQ